jgi:hypothetical protein
MSLFRSNQHQAPSLPPAPTSVSPRSSFALTYPASRSVAVEPEQSNFGSPGKEYCSFTNDLALRAALCLDNVTDLGKASTPSKSEKVVTPAKTDLPGRGT